MAVEVLSIGWVLICCGLGILMGWLDERKWTAPERAVKSFMKKYEKEKEKMKWNAV